LEEFSASGLAWGRIVEGIIVEKLWKHLVNAAPGNSASHYDCIESESLEITRDQNSKHWWAAFVRLLMPNNVLLSLEYFFSLKLPAASVLPEI
jgi:hypothetical protein